MRTFILGMLVAAGPALAEPSAFDRLAAAKLPATLRPQKDAGPEVLAVLNPQRGDRIDCLAIRPDGQFLALSGPDQVVRLWDIEKARLAASAKQPAPVVCLAFTPDGKTLAVGDANGTIRLLRAEGSVLPLRSSMVAHKDMPVWQLAFSPEGDRLYSVGRDPSAHAWNVSKPKPTRLASFTGHEVEARGLALSPDGTVFATAGNQDQTVRFFEIDGEMPSEIARVKLPGRVVNLAYAPDGKRLAVGGAKGVPGILEPAGKSWKRTVELETGGHAATSLGFSREGTHLVGLAGLSDTEDRVLVWDARGRIVHEFKYGLHLHAAAFAPDGRHLVVITEVETLIVRLPG